MPGRDRGGHPGWGRRAGAEAPGGLPQGGRLRSTPAAGRQLLTPRRQAWGQQGSPRGCSPPAAPHPPAVNLGGQAALLLAISEGRLRSVFRDTGSQCHLSWGPDEWAATSIRPLWPLWPPMSGPKLLLTFLLNGAVTPQVTHHGQAAGRAGGSGQGAGDSSGESPEWRCVPAPCNAFPH